MPQSRQLKQTETKCHSNHERILKSKYLPFTVLIFCTSHYDVSQSGKVFRIGYQGWLNVRVVDARVFLVFERPRKRRGLEPFEGGLF